MIWDNFFPNALVIFFADDIAAVLSGQLGVRYTDQCIDLEKRIKPFLDSLDYYSCLADQPLNRTKIKAMFSARAKGSPSFSIVFATGDVKCISWIKECKYLGYFISFKLGWGKLLKDAQCKVRKRIALIKLFKLFGCSSPYLRKALFYSHVLPLFTWIHPIYPLFTRKQQDNLPKFYHSSVRRTLCCLEWNEYFISYVFDEISLEDCCLSYWNRFLKALSNSTDGNLIFEKANLGEIRKSWLDKEFSISGLRRSKRFVPHISILEKVLTCLSSVPSDSSISHYKISEINLFQSFLDSFC